MAKIPRPTFDPQAVKALDKFWRSALGRWVRQAVVRFQEFIAKGKSLEPTLPPEAKPAAQAAHKVFIEEAVPELVECPPIAGGDEECSQVFTNAQLDAAIEILLAKKGGYHNKTAALQDARIYLGKSGKTKQDEAISVGHEKTLDRALMRRRSTIWDEVPLRRRPRR
jgi:hypothetical protein